MALSEHLPDDNLEAELAESSAEETPFDCKGLPHLFDFSEQQDYHQRPAGPDYGYWAYDDTVCKNRWTGPYAKGTVWGVPVNNWQETNVYSEFASSSFFEGSVPFIPGYGSPSIHSSRAFTPTPEVSPINQSPSLFLLLYRQIYRISSKKTM